MGPKFIRSLDLYQDCAVELIIGKEPTIETVDGMVFFVRPASKEVLEAITAYQSGVALNVLRFCQTLKRRRGEMLAAKHGGRP